MATYNKADALLALQGGTCDLHVIPQCGCHPLEAYLGTTRWCRRGSIGAPGRREAPLHQRAAPRRPNRRGQRLAARAPRDCLVGLQACKPAV